MQEFFFGAALSAHQTEGNNIHSDWWKFEQEVLQKQNIAVSGKAANHWELYKKDFALAKDLNFNAQSFTLEWAKIEPTEHEFDQEAIDHYKEVFKALKKNNITPFVTLFHFSLPEWFAEKGGFLEEENIHYFVRFASKVMMEFGDDIDYLCTINEPIIYAFNGYMNGRWPPQKSSYRLLCKVIKNLITAHIEVYKTVKRCKSTILVGNQKNNEIFQPEHKYNIFDIAFAKFLDYKWNHYFLDKTVNYQDFIGINYYFYRNIRVEKKLFKSFYQRSYPSTRRTDLDWEVYPKGIYLIIKDLYKRYKKPLIITENGVADHNDQLRKEVIEETLFWIFKAKDEGADVFGYLHWALIDNYEWNVGFGARFGLIKVDFDNNFTRSIRPSALYYRDLISQYNKKLIQ